MHNTESTLFGLAQQLGRELLSRKLMLATAESCTGGLLSAAITSVAGSSAWFDRGFVTYSNQAKHDMLGVPLALIEQHGAVSEAVARAMAEGALTHASAQVAISITGIAGPDGGSDAKPVGTVWFGLATRSATHTTLTAHHQRFAGDRALVREQAAQFALRLILTTITS